LQICEELGFTLGEQEGEHFLNGLREVVSIAPGSSGFSDRNETQPMRLTTAAKTPAAVRSDSELRGQLNLGFMQYRSASKNPTSCSIFDMSQRKEPNTRTRKKFIWNSCAAGANSRTRSNTSSTFGSTGAILSTRRSAARF
jgi:hypothetical protein